MSACTSDPLSSILNPFKYELCIRFVYNSLFILFPFFFFFPAENDEENGSEDSRTKRRRILGPEFGSIDLNSEEGKKLLAAKSRHVGAVLEVRNE